jgi:hypothetical protein
MLLELQKEVDVVGELNRKDAKRRTKIAWFRR